LNGDFSLIQISGISVLSTLVRLASNLRPWLTGVLTAATGKVITKVALGSSADVDIAVQAARTAFKTTWGLNCPGSNRGELLNKLADLIAQNIDEIAALEALDSGMSEDAPFVPTEPSPSQEKPSAPPRDSTSVRLLQHSVIMQVR
jgi:hypothetical protein